MADIVLKNSDGKIWKNAGGQILKQKSFSESVLQSGLAFWGKADPSYLTFDVNGLISEAYDIRGTGTKMTQATAANRPGYGNGYMTIIGTQALTLASQTAYSLFIVMKTLSGNSQRPGIGVDYQNYLGALSSSGQLLVSNVQGYHYNKLAKYSGYSSATNNVIVALSSLGNFGKSNVTMTVGVLASGVNACIYEWGWYNRLLTEVEVIYNQNALMKKYSIT